MLQMSAVETGQMSSVKTGQMFAVETGQMSAVETGQMSAVETRQMSSAETRQMIVHPGLTLDLQERPVCQPTSKAQRTHTRVISRQK